MISKTAIIHPNVKLGSNCTIEDFAVIGSLPSGVDKKKRSAGIKLETIIGDNALIRSHTVIYAGNRIGDNFQTGNKANIRELNEIGDNVSVGTLSVIEHHVKIGNNVRIHSQAFIPEFTVLEDESWIGPNVVFTNVLHPLCPKAKECIKGATVKRCAKVGANSTILPDIVIGEGSLIGAGSVVTKDVPPFKIAAGNPAKVIKDVSRLKCPYNLLSSHDQEHDQKHDEKDEK